MEDRIFEAVILIEPKILKEPLDEEEYIGFFEGIASTPEIDLDGDKFLPEVLKKNAENLKNKPILLIHGRDSSLRGKPVGKIIDAWVENGSLKIRAGIFKAFYRIWDCIKKGVLRALSIGGVIKRARNEGGINIIEDAEIREVSLTPKGVNPSAKILKFFGKSFEIDEELGFLKEIIKDEAGKDMSRDFKIEKADLSLPIIQRENWDGEAAAKRIFEWAEREDGSIDKSKASKLFLVIEGDGSRRKDYSWPIGDIVDGKPVLVSSGILTAIKYASRTDFEVPEKVRADLEKLAERLKREGILVEDYVVPWKREKSEIYEKLEELAKRLEKLEKAVLVESRSCGGFSKSCEVKNGFENRHGRSLATLDESIKKTLERRLMIHQATIFRNFYKELHGIISD